MLAPVLRLRCGCSCGLRGRGGGGRHVLSSKCWATSANMTAVSALPMTEQGAECAERIPIRLKFCSRLGQLRRGARGLGVCGPDCGEQSGDLYRQFGERRIADRDVCVFAGSTTCPLPGVNQLTLGNPPFRRCHTLRGELLTRALFLTRHFLGREKEPTQPNPAPKEGRLPFRSSKIRPRLECLEGVRDVRKEPTGADGLTRLPSD